MGYFGKMRNIIYNYMYCMYICIYILYTIPFPSKHPQSMIPNMFSSFPLNHGFCGVVFQGKGSECYDDMTEGAVRIN